MADIIRDQAQPLRELVGNRTKTMKVITIASGKGGVGKSSISVNLAIALSELGMRVLVVDADFGLANIDVMLGVNSRYNLSHFIKGEKEIGDIIQAGYRGVKFISGGSGVFELLQMDENQLKHIMDDLMHMDSPVDIILFDSGAGINENVLSLILASSETIVVTTPEPTAILDAYALIKTVVKRESGHLIRLIMNKAENRREALNAIDGFQKVVRRNLSAEIESLGYVLFDNDVSKSIKRQTPLIISSPDSTTARDIMSIARALMNLPEKPTATNRLSRLFYRLLG